MKYLIWFFAIFVLLIFQAGVLSPLGISPVNLALVLVVMAMLCTDFDTALVITLTSGILLDLVSGNADGLNALTLFSVLLIMNLIMHSLVNREPNWPVLFSSVAGFTALFFLVFLAFNRFFAIFNLGIAIDYKTFFVKDLPLTLLFNLIFTYPVFRYFSWVEKLIPKTPHGKSI
jgi:cell shape-determining protein MreD